MRLREKSGRRGACDMMFERCRIRHERVAKEHAREALTSHACCRCRCLMPRHDAARDAAARVKPHHPWRRDAPDDARNAAAPRRTDAVAAHDTSSIDNAPLYCHAPSFSIDGAQPKLLAITRAVPMRCAATNSIRSSER